MRTFDPDRIVQSMREDLEALAAAPGWREYTADKAERLVAEDHGMWKPLADLAKSLKQSLPRAGRAPNPRRYA